MATLTGVTTMTSRTFEDGVAAMRDQVLGIVSLYSVSNVMSANDSALFSDLVEEIGLCAEASIEDAPVRHPDDAAIDRFAEALRQYAAWCRGGVEGFASWRYAQPRTLWAGIREQVSGGSPLKAALICMMVWHNRLAIGARQKDAA